MCYRKGTLRENKSNMLTTLKMKMKSGSMHNLTNVGNNNNNNSTAARPSFSVIVGGGTMTGTRGVTSAVQKKAMAKNRLGTLSNADFKVSEPYNFYHVKSVVLYAFCKTHYLFKLNNSYYIVSSTIYNHYSVDKSTSSS